MGHNGSDAGPMPVPWMAEIGFEVGTHFSFKALYFQHFLFTAIVAIKILAIMTFSTCNNIQTVPLPLPTYYTHTFFTHGNRDGVRKLRTCLGKNWVANSEGMGGGFSISPKRGRVGQEVMRSSPYWGANPVKEKE